MIKWIEESPRHWIPSDDISDIYVKTVAEDKHLFCIERYSKNGEIILASATTWSAAQRCAEQFIKDLNGAKQITIRATIE